MDESSSSTSCARGQEELRVRTPDLVAREHTIPDLQIVDIEVRRMQPLPVREHVGRTPVNHHFASDQGENPQQRRRVHEVHYLMHHVWIVHQVGLHFPDRLEIHRLHRPQKRRSIRVQESGGFLGLPVEQFPRVDDQAGELSGLNLLQAKAIERVHQSLKLLGAPLDRWKNIRLWIRGSPAPSHGNWTVGGEVEALGIAHLIRDLVLAVLEESNVRPGAAVPTCPSVRYDVPC